MTTAPSTRTLSPSGRVACLDVAGAPGCPAVSSGIVILAASYVLASPDPISPLAGVSPPPSLAALPILTSEPTMPSTEFATAPRTPAHAPIAAIEAPASPANRGTWRGVHASFRDAYPSDWTADNGDESDGIVIFISPHQAAAASVTTLQSGHLCVEQALDRINNQILRRDGPVDATPTVENANASTNMAVGGRVYSFARLERVTARYQLAVFEAHVEEHEVREHREKACRGSQCDSVAVD